MRNSEILNSQFKERFTQPFSNIINQRGSDLGAFPNLKFQTEDRITRETLNSIYGDNYDSIQLNMQIMENEAISYFKTTTEELQEKYKEFNININSHFNGVTNKIANVFKLNNPNEDVKNVQRNSLIRKYSNEYLEQLNKIINMHEQIFKNVKDSISIFFKYLEISKFLDKEKPIQEFISKEFENIIQNWLFLKINVENFNFAKAIYETKLDDDFKNFIFKICKDKNFVMGISSNLNYMIDSNKNIENLDERIHDTIKEIKTNNKKIMEDNQNNLIKLTMNNVFSVDKYFDKNIKYRKMRYLKLDNVTFDEKKSNKNFLENLPALENLIINSSNNLEISLLENLSKSLVKLSLTKNGFVDYDFNNIMSNYLVKSDTIRKNLQVLSFSNNNLSNIDISQIVYQPKQSFYALKELNFEKNKIYKFNILPEFFVELKFINCCSNCFTKSPLEQYDNIITLLSGNTFLTKISLAKKFFSSLEKKLNNPFFCLRFLNLSYIPKILSNDYLSKIVINDSILINLKKLDLSHNYIKSDTIFKFFENNKGCLSLKLLNLSYNLLDDSFFEQFLDLKLHNLFSKLKYIYLDSNKFGTYKIINKEEEKNRNLKNNENKEDISRIKLLYKFILENNNLIEITLTKNPMKNKFLFQSIEENKNDFNFSNFVKKDENKNIEINCLYSFLWKLKIEIYGENTKRTNEIRPKLNIKFDCLNKNNINFSDFDFTKNYIIFNN